MGNAYAASNNSGGIGILGWIILLVTIGFIIASVAPQIDTWDASSGNNNSQQQKCSTPGCPNTTDIVNGKCSVCRWAEEHGH